jgi:hypothetical protein
MWVNEGEFVIEVSVDMIESPDGWSPLLSPDEAAKLDIARKHLRAGDIESAKKYGVVYKAIPVS